MALYYKWDVKNGFVDVFQSFLFISDSLGGVGWVEQDDATRENVRQNQGDLLKGNDKKSFRSSFRIFRRLHSLFQYVLFSVTQIGNIII